MALMTEHSQKSIDLTSFLAISKDVDFVLTSLDKILDYFSTEEMSSLKKEDLVVFISRKISCVKDILKNIPCYEDLKGGVLSFEKENSQEKDRMEERLSTFESMYNELVQEKKMWKLFLVDEMFESLQDKWLTNYMDESQLRNIIDTYITSNEDNRTKVLESLIFAVKKLDHYCQRLYKANLDKHFMILKLQKQLVISSENKMSDASIYDYENSGKADIIEYQMEIEVLETELRILKDHNILLSQQMDEILLHENSEEKSSEKFNVETNTDCDDMIEYIKDYTKEFLAIIKEKNKRCDQLVCDLTKSKVCAQSNYDRYEESLMLISKLIQNFCCDISLMRSQFQELKLGEASERNKRHRLLYKKLKSVSSTKDETILKLKENEKELLEVLENNKKMSDIYFQKLKDKIDAKTCQIKRLEAQLNYANETITEINIRFEKEIEAKNNLEKEKMFIKEIKDSSQIEISCQRKLIGNMKSKIRNMKGMKLYKRGMSKRHYRFKRLSAKLKKKSVVETEKNLRRQNANLLYAIGEYENILLKFRMKMCSVISILFIEMENKEKLKRENDCLKNKNTTEFTNDSF